MAANAAYANLMAEQYAFIDSLKLINGNVTVDARLNQGSDTPAGAEAILGGNGIPGKTADGNSVSIAFTFIEGKANTAVALADGKNRAWIENTSIIVSGDILVNVSGNSIARADIYQESASIGFAGVGVNVLYAKAEGDFKAYISMNETIIDAGNITVSSQFVSDAYARSIQPAYGSAEI